MSPIGQPNPNFSAYSNFGQGTPKVVYVEIISTILLLANSTRVYVQFNNNSNVPIWLSKGISAVVGQGTRLNPRSMLTFSGSELCLLQLNAIAESPTNIDVEEGVT